MWYESKSSCQYVLEVVECQWVNVSTLIRTMLKSIRNIFTVYSSEVGQWLVLPFFRALHLPNCPNFFHSTTFQMTNAKMPTRYRLIQMKLPIAPRGVDLCHSYDFVETFGVLLAEQKLLQRFLWHTKRFNTLTSIWPWQTLGHRAWLITITTKN